MYVLRIIERWFLEPPLVCQSDIFQHVDQPQTPYTPGHLKSRKGTGSKTPRFLLRFYYVWRPRFAGVCHALPFRPIILDSMCLHRALRKVRQNAANRAFTGRKTNMIKVLFICHGRVFPSAWGPCIYWTSGECRREIGTLLGQLIVVI